MLMRIIIAAVLACSLAAPGTAGERGPATATAAAAPTIVQPVEPAAVGVGPGGQAVPRTPLASQGGCASECQTHHDRCRVRTKGSPSCDAERQACLQKCLQRKSAR